MPLHDFTENLRKFDSHERGLLLHEERESGDGVRLLMGRPTACVGRDKELAFIEGIFAECESEPVARVVLVTAPADAFAAAPSANRSPPGSVMPRWRARRSTNWRPTTSSMVLDALFTSMP